MRAAERLGVLLREVGFGEDRYFALVGLPPGDVPPAEVLAVLHRTEDARLARLHEIFWKGETVSPARAAHAVDPVPVADLIEARVLEADGAGVRAAVKMATIGGVIVAGDFPRSWGDPQFVTGLSVPGRSVAYTTVRNRIRTALDVGTGSGIQALLAARHTERVVGVDVNPHALWLAGLVQQLNGVDNTTWLEGDWFEPARGERFDLVTVNPPVTISPDNTVLARDSPMGGTELSRQMVREAADHLADGGFATVLCNWAHREGDWEGAPREWVAELDCDAVVLNFASEDPLMYALSNVLERPDPDPDCDAETIKRWTDHYRRTGVERIGVGVVVLRRRSSGSPWVQAFQTDGGPSGWGGNHLERIFAGGDFLASRSGAEVFRDLLSTPWRLVDHRLDQRLVHENGAYATGGALLVHETGLGVSATVDPRVVPLIVGCDGRHPLATVLGGTPVPEDLEKAAFQQLCLATVRDLIARGYLVGDGWPVEDPGRQGAAREVRA
jgi:hypothetical protein